MNHKVIISAFLCFLVSMSTAKSTGEEQERSDLAGHGLLPSFFQSNIASVCHALIGDLCPRQNCPYNERDSRDNPIMGNSKLHDIQFTRRSAPSGRSEVEPVVARRPVWPAPGEKPRAKQERLRFVDDTDVNRKPEEAGSPT